MEAIKLKPVYKDYPWGGSRLKTEYGKADGPDILAESWELSCHPNGLSRIRGTETTLRDWLADRRDFDGPGQESETGQTGGGEFPLIVKLIDAKEKLSVQVHPDDGYARAHEGGHGKAELWYVMEHEPGAYIYLGFRRDVTKDEIRAAVSSGSLESMLNRIEVRTGDVFFLPAGTVHAVGGGVLLAEIQQNSDLTYRLYDYGRTDEYGGTRELHVKKALDVIHTSATRRIPVHREIWLPAAGHRQSLIGRHTSFSVFEVDIPHHAELTLCRGGFTYLLIIDGACSLSFADAVYALSKGDGLLLPKGEESYAIDGRCLCLRVHGQMH
ncbi:MAG: class I mannose-6-phosphate isomerase [Clostridiales Family XIII bacterium]|jgi:mannose-6-phosphate isomerase|nr:class I mannose-6-phosphate isomerase [Clostridiales Family XIII bacterium]